MGIVRKTITLTEQQDNWITEQVTAGRYTNESEAIRDLIRREQARTEEIESIRHSLIDGERSGEPEPFDFDAFLRRMKVELGSVRAEPGRDTQSTAF